MFENVNYSYYHDTLGRSVVPDAQTFNRYIPEAKRYMLPLVPFLVERISPAGGIDAATCMVVEETYQAAASSVPDGAIVASESIDSYSRSFKVDGSAGNSASTGAKKEAWIDMYCLRKELR